MSGGAEQVHFGGEIFDDRSTKDSTVPHTTTEMGSGHFSGEKYGGASFFDNVMLIDNEHQAVVLPDEVGAVYSKPKCYDLTMSDTGPNGMLFYFGGPGWNGNCP
ncbi:hypothetical protein QJS10_CPB20g00485 [Acorus calamus]|uniref:Neprosin PEP catalytic domain-containing protein n=1 Tax=Acorus calamus TaxID=4465 RepID=A0AAV9CBB9_ACOCL|nr:hypothetical protein QJS10_CPB20g00485 [Acorus calamus]